MNPRIASKFGFIDKRVLLAFVWMALTFPVFAQTAATSRAPSAATSKANYVPTLRFDVVSIRESPESKSYTVSFGDPPHSSLLKLTNITVMDMIVMAYGVNFSRIMEVPDWAESIHYIVQAGSDRSVDEKLAKLSDEKAKLEKQHMLQMLLADRFQLRIKREIRESTTFNLVLAKDGPKMSTKLLPPAKDQIAWFKGSPVPPLYQYGDGRLGYEYIAHACTMGMLVEVLSGQMNTEVSDETGLTGNYDFTLQYSGTVPGTESSDPNAWPLLINALPAQLGLKLEPAKGAVDVVVIDHIEKPSAN